MSLNWKNLDKSEQLAQIVERSYQVPVGIFKHSTRCGISLQVKENLEQSWDFEKEEVEVYYLDLLNYRPISNQIASDFGVMHQSPQLIVLKDGKVAYYASHHSISTKSLHEKLLVKS